MQRLNSVKKEVEKAKDKEKENVCDVSSIRKSDTKVSRKGSITPFTENNQITEFKLCSPIKYGGTYSSLLPLNLHSSCLNEWLANYIQKIPI